MEQSVDDGALARSLQNPIVGEPLPGTVFNYKLRPICKGIRKLHHSLWLVFNLTEISSLTYADVRIRKLLKFLEAVLLRRDLPLGFPIR
jgi:hypothetical protein